MKLLFVAIAYIIISRHKRQRDDAKWRKYCHEVEEMERDEARSEITGW